MSELVKYAKRELKNAGLFDKDSDYDGMIGESVLELIKVLSRQGHSVFSKEFVLTVFNRLSEFKPLNPLSGNDDEFIEVGHGLLQNTRCGSVFKINESKKCNYIDAIVWVGDDGNSFYGTVDGICSSLTIRKFPFDPKTFEIPVTYDSEEDEYHITNLDDLNKVEALYVLDKESGDE